jgi:hypothetical protein
VRVGLVLAVAFFAAGCASGGGRSVLHQGLVSPSGTVVPISDREARDAARVARQQWLAALRTRAREHPRRRFDNPSPSELRSRLHDLAGRYGFDVVSAEVLHPRQDAPVVVVRTTHYRDLARATPAILERLDPRRRGWRYEGFFWEARDERGVPFLIASTLARGQVAGSQWARSEALFPYHHG